MKLPLLLQPLITATAISMASSVAAADDLSIPNPFELRTAVLLDNKWRTVIIEGSSVVSDDHIEYSLRCHDVKVATHSDFFVSVSNVIEAAKFDKSGIFKKRVKIVSDAKLKWSTVTIWSNEQIRSKQPKSSFEIPMILQDK